MATAKPKKKSFIFASVLFVLSSAFLLPTFVFIFIAMLPTLVAIIKGNALNRFEWVCIMGMNMTGMLPYLFELWLGVHDMIAVMDMLLDVSTIIVIYGCAAIGWLFYVFIPPIIVGIVSITDQHKVKILKKKQDVLTKRWGEEIVDEKDNKASSEES